MCPTVNALTSGEHGTAVAFFRNRRDGLGGEMTGWRYPRIQTLHAKTNPSLEYASEPLFPKIFSDMENLIRGGYGFWFLFFFLQGANRR